MKRFMNNVRKYGLGATVSAGLITAAGTASAQTASATATAVETAMDQIETDIISVYGPALLGIAIAATGFFIGLKFLRRGSSSV